MPETVEMARVTGLTLADVLYKAQMVRVQVSVSDLFLHS